MTAVSVEFRDHSEFVMELLDAKVRGGIFNVCRELAEQYREKLSTPAPPHSAPGEIPHAYLGHKPGGWGPVNGPPGSRNNPGQTRFLKDFIQSGTNVVGFAPSHVSGREDNYLINWDAGYSARSAGRGRRPWIKRVYRQSKPLLIAAFKEGFDETE